MTPLPTRPRAERRPQQVRTNEGITAGPKLSPEQIDYFKLRMVEHGTPARFLYQGRCLDIVTGALDTKGINIIHQRHYWHFTAATAREIASALGEGVRVVLSE
jgi:hypothetical protein